VYGSLLCSNQNEHVLISCSTWNTVILCFVYGKQTRWRTRSHWVTLHVKDDKQQDDKQQICSIWTCPKINNCATCCLRRIVLIFILWKDISLSVYPKYTGYYCGRSDTVVVFSALCCGEQIQQSPFSANRSYVCMHCPIVNVNVK